MEPQDPLARAAFSAEKLAKTNLFDSERWFVDVYGLLPGQAQKPHRHDDADKLYFALEGSGFVTIGAKESPLARGQLAVCPAGAEHGVRAGGERLVLLVAMTKPGMRSP